MGILLIVLAGTAIGQVIFLNRALQRFEASRVVPTHFTLFSLSAILGSAILFRDFEAWAWFRLEGFLLACGTTFVGVYILAQPKVVLPPAPSPTTSTTTPTPTPPTIPTSMKGHERRPAATASSSSSVVPFPDHSTRQQPPHLPVDDIPHSSELRGSFYASSTSTTNDPMDGTHGESPGLATGWLPARPQLRTANTDTATLAARPILTPSANSRPLLSGRRRRLPALALSTGQYLLLPLDPPPLEQDDHPTPGVTSAVLQEHLDVNRQDSEPAVETRSDVGGPILGRSWSWLVQSGMSVPLAVSRSVDTLRYASSN